MDNFDNNVFGFGEKQDDTSNFNYENISGLGESNYENEDLFDNIPEVNTETQPQTEIPPFETQPIETSIPSFYNNENADYSNIFDLNSGDMEPTVQDAQPAVSEPVENTTYVEPIEPTTVETQPVVDNQVEEKAYIEPLDIPTINESIQPVENNAIPSFETQPAVQNNTESFDQNISNTIEPVEETAPSFEIPTVLPNVEPTTDISTPVEEKPSDEVNNLYSIPEASPEIPMSETSIDELQKLTEYEEEKIDSTDINSLFDKISVNVKDASEIFRKNTSLKEKIDSRFEELKSLQSELTNSRKKQMEEIDKYKDEVLDKLTEKKEEIEKRLNTLKELQATLEKEKAEFEEYKRTEQANISKIQKQVQNAYDERREELEKIEDVLRKQKDALDEERNQLSIDKIQYEADKNELANNLIKFNQIVNSFTSGLDIKPEE